MKQIKCDDCPCLHESVETGCYCTLGYETEIQQNGDDWLWQSEDCKLVKIFTEDGEKDYKPVILGEVHDADTETR